MLALPALIHRANQNREHMTKYRAYASTVFTTPAAWNATPGDRPILQGSTIKSAFENTSLYAIPLQVGELSFTAESVIWHPADLAAMREVVRGSYGAGSQGKRQNNNVPTADDEEKREKEAKKRINT